MPGALSRAKHQRKECVRAQSTNITPYHIKLSINAANTQAPHTSFYHQLYFTPFYAHKHTISSQHLNLRIAVQATQRAAGPLSRAGSQITFLFTAYEILQRGCVVANECDVFCLLWGIIHEKKIVVDVKTCKSHASVSVY